MSLDKIDFAQEVERLNYRIRLEEEMAANALMWAEVFKHQRKLLYEAHTAKPLHTRTPCDPNCGVCRDAIREMDEATA